MGKLAITAHCMHAPNYCIRLLYCIKHTLNYCTRLLYYILHTLNYGMRLLYYIHHTLKYCTRLLYYIQHVHTSHLVNADCVGLTENKLLSITRYCIVTTRWSLTGVTQRIIALERFIGLVLKSGIQLSNDTLSCTKCVARPSGKSESTFRFERTQYDLGARLPQPRYAVGQGWGGAVEGFCTNPATRNHK